MGSLEKFSLFLFYSISNKNKEFFVISNKNLIFKNLIINPIKVKCDL